MNKRAIAILGAILLLIVGTLGFLIYSKYSTKTPSTSQVTPTPTPTGGSDNNNGTSTNPTTSPTPPLQSNSNIVNLTSDQVVSPAMFFNGSGISYFDHQGHLFMSNLQNNNGVLQLTGKRQLDIPPKQNISKILWPAKGNDFIAQFTDPTGKTKWSYFNSSSGVYTDLPPQVETVDWMPNGTQIMYVWLENGKSTLNIANADSTNWKFLADMWENDDTISVSPDGTQILYYETANSAVDNAINSVTVDGKVWKVLVKTGQNFGVLWSPDGQKFVFAKKDVNTQKYQLWLNNLGTGEVKNLGLFTTVDKVIWDKDSNLIYAAVPVTGTPGPTSLTVDTFFKMDTTTLDKQQHAPNPSSPIDGRDLFLNSTGDKLMFRNAQDGGLYYLDLSK